MATPGVLLGFEANQLFLRAASLRDLMTCCTVPEP
jgi:hypothetical protein